MTRDDQIEALQAKIDGFQQELNELKIQVKEKVTQFDNHFEVFFDNYDSTEHSFVLWRGPGKRFKENIRDDHEKIYFNLNEKQSDVYIWGFAHGFSINNKTIFIGVDSANEENFKQTESQARELALKIANGEI